MSLNRDSHPREFEPNLEDEREVPLNDEALEDGLEVPPPTVDPEERVEADVEDADVPLDDERPV